MPIACSPSVWTQPQVCQHFLRGTCSFGEDCRYVHAYSSAPDVELAAELAGHTDNVTGVSLVGDQLYSCSKDGTVKVWDSASGQCTTRCANAD